MSSVTERFLKYVSFDTQSDETSSTCPSTAKQKLLGVAIVEEMKALGITNPYMDEDGYVYGTVPGERIAEDFRIAFREIFQNPFLRLFIPCALILNLLGAGPMTLMLPFMLEKGFTVDMYGYAMSAETFASLVAVVLLGIIKLKPRTRYLAMAIGFISTVFLSTGAYLAGSFPTVTVLLFLNSFMNMLANSVFNASLMLALPEENRGAILGFISAFSTGGCALSAVIFGVLGDLFPLYLVFMAGNVLSLLPMLYLCLHKKTKEFVLSH